MQVIIGTFPVQGLEQALFEVPALWVHGHTHTSFDYRVGNCRVVCNPRGYPQRQSSSYENAAFDSSGLGIELAKSEGT